MDKDHIAAPSEIRKMGDQSHHQILSVLLGAWRQFQIPPTWGFAQQSNSIPTQRTALKIKFPLEGISATHSHQGLTISYVGGPDIHNLCAQIKLLNSDLRVVGQLVISEPTHMRNLEKRFMNFIKSFFDVESEKRFNLHQRLVKILLRC